MRVMYCFETTVISEQGIREKMEDAHCLIKVDKKGTEIFGGVYDGHGGGYAAEYVKEHLHEIFFEELKKKTSPEKAFAISYEEISDQLKNQPSGTTAVNFYIKNNIIYHANVGDGRLIVVSDKKITQLSYDHRLTDKSERKRIVESGGFIDDPHVWKDGYGMMPTRTLGDEYFKDVGIIATPSVGQYQLQLTDRWLVAGTDGLFDFMENKEIAKMVRDEPDIKIAGEQIKKETLKKSGEADNLTIILVKINGSLRIKDFLPMRVGFHS